MTEQKTKFTPEEREEAVSEMVEAIKVYVTRIEGKTATTRNHYGDYMSLIGQIEDRGTQRGVAQALIAAGGNRQGVIDGFKAATGLDFDL